MVPLHLFTLRMPLQLHYRCKYAEYNLLVCGCLVTLLLTPLLLLLLLIVHMQYVRWTMPLQLRWRYSYITVTSTLHLMLHYRYICTAVTTTQRLQLHSRYNHTAVTTTLPLQQHCLYNYGLLARCNYNAAVGVYTTMLRKPIQVYCR